MAWTEMKQPPTRLVGDRIAARAGGGGQGGPGGPAGPAPATRVEARPYAATPQPALSSRAIFPYPFVAQYTGTGDQNDAANYKAVKTPVPVPQIFNTEVSRLIGPNNQKFYHIEGDTLVPDKVK
jgi:feruloyl esterase